MNNGTRTEVPDERRAKKKNKAKGEWQEHFYPPGERLVQIFDLAKRLIQSITKNLRQIDSTDVYMER